MSNDTPMKLTPSAVRMLHALKTGPKTANELASRMSCSNGAPRYLFNKLKKYNLVTLKRVDRPNSRGSTSKQLLFALKPGAKFPELGEMNKIADDDESAMIAAPELTRLERRLQQALDEVRRLRNIIIPLKSRNVIMQLIKSGIRLGK